MRGDHPVVSAASLIVRPSIGGQTLTQLCQGSPGAGASAGFRGAAALRELLAGLLDPCLALRALGVGHGLAGELLALGGGGEAGEFREKWHARVLPRSPRRPVPRA